MRTPSVIALVSLIAGLASCTNAKIDKPNLAQPTKPSEQKLLVNLAGQAIVPSPSGDPEKGEPQGELGGQCTPDVTRSELKCDIYNGLRSWKVSEVTLLVTHSPYGDGDMREFRIPVSLEPLTTEQVTVRLGMQLPADTIIRVNGSNDQLSHWSWTFGPAQGHRVN